MVDTLTCKHGNLAYVSTTRQRRDIPRQQLVVIPNAWNKSHYCCTTTDVNRWLHLEGSTHQPKSASKQRKTTPGHAGRLTSAGFPAVRQHRARVFPTAKKFNRFRTKVCLTSSAAGLESVLLAARSWRVWWLNRGFCGGPTGNSSAVFEEVFVPAAVYSSSLYFPVWLPLR